MKDLEGKCLLISGGSGGIGGAIAERAAAAGGRVFIGYSSGETRAEVLAQTIRGRGCSAESVRLDVTDLSSVESAVSRASSGSGRLDGLVSCAGMLEAGPLIGLAKGAVERQIAVNLTGAIHLAQAAATVMVRNRSGSIVQIGSVSAHRMTRGHSVYSAAKAGLEGFTKALAAELAKRSVRVNCLVPGPVETRMLRESVEITGDDPASRVPMGRILNAGEVADAALFLLSDRSAAITGTILPVDGGYLLW